MRQLMLTLAILTTLVVAPAAANAQGFLLGMAVGGALFGGSSQYAGGGAMILYSADEEKLKATNPLDVRLASIYDCFRSDFKPNKSDKTLGELFGEVTAAFPKKERVILQIARVFQGMPACATIWFAYIEK